MKFRFSEFEEVPDEAVEEDIEVWDQRTFETPEDYDRKYGGKDGPWHSVGRAHSTWHVSDAEGQHGIQRLIPHRAHTLEVPDLAALMALMGKDGSMLINAAEPPEPPKIILNAEYYD